MREVLTESLVWYNLPLTVLLGLLLIYWLSAMIGFVGMESFDLDLDVDADVDADADLDLDAGVGGGGIGLAALKFLNFGEVPAMVVLSVLALSLWTISMIANHVLNPGGGILAAGGIFAGNLVVSALITKLLTAPLKPLMRALAEDSDTHEPIVGRACVVRSLKVTESHGQAEIERDGANLLIHVRVGAGSEPLERGGRALVIEHDSENDFFLIRGDAPGETQDNKEERQ